MERFFKVTEVTLRNLLHVLTSVTNQKLEQGCARNVHILRCYCDETLNNFHG